ncbi:adenosylcobinamide-phosphate synthase CbiB [Litoribacillus peritrichatus]|uniref:Cobalamin biosynthesis protein CobD n=1 Tax=Litoribacillus peritrichatus TaxID=718191 RepID=A0ABP7MBS8_9GAMM
MALVISVFILIFAVLLDLKFGEPKRYHPLVGFGHWVVKLESFLNHETSYSERPNVVIKAKGTIAWAIAVVPIAFVLAWLVARLPMPIYVVVSIAVLYLSIGHKSLQEHILPIAEALLKGDQDEARRLTSMIVSRDPAEMNIEKSAIESALENGSDSVFAPIFWFLVAGPVGALVYRLANTLDAMWGYRTERYFNFGWAAAKIDDALNYIPARLTAFSYLVVSKFMADADAKVGGFRKGLRCWREQAALLSSPNGGPVMAAGAGALGITLGGRTCYHGKWQEKPEFGCGPEATAEDIPRAMQMVTYTLGLWVSIPFLAVILVLFMGWAA